MRYSSYGSSRRFRACGIQRLAIAGKYHGLDRLLVDLVLSPSGLLYKQNTAIPIGRAESYSISGSPGCLEALAVWVGLGGLGGFSRVEGLEWRDFIFLTSKIGVETIGIHTSVPQRYSRK